MFTISQIASIVALLIAFNVPTSTVQTVETILNNTQTSPKIIVMPDQTQSVTITPTTSAPDLVSSPAPTPTPVPAPVSQGRFAINAYSVSADGKRSPALVARSGTFDMIRFEVQVFDQNGTFQKLPVTVTTDDPDLPSQWTFNGQGQINWFEVCQYYNVSNGACPVGPHAIGTFTVTFTQPDLNLSQSFQFTVTPKDN